MTDHEAAVKLYEKYGRAEWWPKVAYHSDIDRWKTAFELSESDQFGISKDHALAAIGWAMVERLGTINLCEDAEGNYAYWEYEVGVGGNTRFQALAAAVEAVEAGR